MAWFKRKPRNRRLSQDNVLAVRLRAKPVKAARLRLGVAAVSVCFGTVFGVYVVWRASEWLLDRMVYSNPAFAIRQIDVETDGVIRPQQLRRWARVRVGDNLMSLDLGRVKRDLEMVSAIRSVAVERELPNILHIHVSEREPVAQIAFLTGPLNALRAASYFLDADGYVIKPLNPFQLQHFTNSLPAGLPRITGFRRMDVVAGRRLDSDQLRSALHLIQLHDCSPMAALAAFQEIDISHPQVLETRTSDGSQITFGVENLEQQLLRWHEVYEWGQARHLGISSLDLSVSNNVPARWVQLNTAPSVASPPARASRNSRTSHRNV